MSFGRPYLNADHNTYTMVCEHTKCQLELDDGCFFVLGSTDLNEASKTKSNKVKAAVKTQSPSNPSRDIRCPSKDIRRPSRGIRRPSRKMRPKVAKIKCNQCCYEAPNRRTLRKHQEQHQRAEYRLLSPRSTLRPCLLSLIIMIFTSP